MMELINIAIGGSIAAAVVALLTALYYWRKDPILTPGDDMPALGAIGIGLAGFGVLLPTMTHPPAIALSLWAIALMVGAFIGYEIVYRIRYHFF